jgi:hypothetical protein
MEASVCWRKVMATVAGCQYRPGTSREREREKGKGRRRRRRRRRTKKKTRPTDPVVHPQPRDTPEDNHIPTPKHLASPDEASNHDGNPDIREHDQGQLVLLEEDAVFAKVEVHDLPALCPVVLLSGQVEQQISRPAEELVDKVMPQGGNGGVLRQLCKLDHACLGLGAKVGLDP